MATLLGEHDTPLWRVLHHYVEQARARGYRTTRNLITMVYLIAGKLKFALPT